MRAAGGPARSTLSDADPLSLMSTSRNGKKRRSRLRRSHSRPGKQLPTPDSSRVDTGLPATSRGACSGVRSSRNAATLRGISLTSESCSCGHLLDANAELAKYSGARRSVAIGAETEFQPAADEIAGLPRGPPSPVAAARAEVACPAPRQSACAWTWRSAENCRGAVVEPRLSPSRSRPRRSRGGRRTSARRRDREIAAAGAAGIGRAGAAMQLLERDRKIGQARSARPSKAAPISNAPAAAARRDNAASPPSKRIAGREVATAQSRPRESRARG